MLLPEPEAFLDGQFLLFDKPLRWTSFKLVAYVRGFLRTYTGNRKIKVGHAGTLDPMATGLMVICTGKMTKQIDQFKNLDKVYTGRMQLGASTPSYDAETEIDARFPWEHVNLNLLREAAQSFTGPLDQIPPAFSAVQQNGKRLYDLARAGRFDEIRKEPRRVRVDRFEITTQYGPEFSFEIACSSGTYIRSLAHDLGKSVGSGAHLTALCRTHIGAYSLSEAHRPEAWSAAFQSV
ncbi:tRNA pseudouridine(55) synthase TruB [bacterium]|nr:tRNA pseudouridine(55) synthase TruB [bacterium]